jgi:hypothetical protein
MFSKDCAYRLGWVALASVVVVVFVLSAEAKAAIALEAKGWRLTMPTWAVPTSGGAVKQDIYTPDDPNTLTIQIFKNFVGSPQNQSQMPVVITTFTQIAADAQTASRIVINDEGINNNTTVGWDDFHYVLIRGGYASFNQAQTFPGDFGGSASQNFDISPFTQHGWQLIKPDISDPGTWYEQLDLTGGAGVPSGDGFFPGSQKGELVIDVNLLYDGAAQGGWFQLKEVPTMPEPMTALVLAIGGVGMLVRRRTRAKCA